MGNYESLVSFPFKNDRAKIMCLLNEHTCQIEDKQNFLDLLYKNSSKNIRVFTVFGRFGDGKSTFLNFLLRSYLNSGQNSQQIFSMCDQFYIQGQRSIEYFQIVERDTITVFLKIRDFDQGQQSDDEESYDQEKKSNQLLSLIFKISNSIFLISGRRIAKPMLQMISGFDDQSRFKDFILILTKQSNYEDQKYSLLEQKFDDIVFFNFLSYMKTQDNCFSYSCNVEIDEIFKNLVDKHITNKKYNKKINQLIMFKENQTCEALHDYLIFSYALLDYQFGKFKSSTKSYLKVIDSYQAKFYAEDNTKQFEEEYIKSPFPQKKSYYSR